MGLYVEYLDEKEKVKYTGTKGIEDLLLGEEDLGREAFRLLDLIGDDGYLATDKVIFWDEDVYSAELDKIVFVYCGEVSFDDEMFDEDSEVPDDKYGLVRAVDENGDKFLVVTCLLSDLPLDPYDIKKDNDLESLLEEIKGTEIDSTKLRNIRKTKQRNDDDVLKYEITPEDNSLVQLLKEYINSIELHTSDVYSYFENDGDAWNLIYGLRKRSSITWDYFLNWMNVLNCEIDLTIIPKSK